MIHWLVVRGALVWLAILSMLGGPIAILWFIPRRPFAGHAAAHAAWQAVAITVWVWLAGRAIVRWSRVPGEIVSLILFLVATSLALVGLMLVSEPAARVQNAVFLVLFGALATWNLHALVRAWRQGWRPKGAGDEAARHAGDRGAA